MGMSMLSPRQVWECCREHHPHFIHSLLLSIPCVVEIRQHSHLGVVLTCANKRTWEHVRAALGMCSRMLYSKGIKQARSSPSSPLGYQCSTGSWVWLGSMACCRIWGLQSLVDIAVGSRRMSKVYVDTALLVLQPHGLMLDHRYPLC